MTEHGYVKDAHDAQHGQATQTLQRTIFFILRTDGTFFFVVFLQVVENIFVVALS